MAIEVGSKVKAIVENHARKACQKFELKDGDFSQDANALAVYNSLREVGAIPDGLDKEVVAEALQVCKKGGNASALRQALFSEKKQKESAIAGELLDMVD